MEPLVAVVLVNWNRPQDTLECIESLRHMNYRRFLTILVDNGSTDGSLEAFSVLEDVELISNGANLGIARANNVGIRRALEAGADYVLLLNNDTIVDGDMVRILVETCEADPTIGMVGPTMYYHDEPTTIWYAGGRIHPWRGDTSHVGMLEEDRGQYGEVTDTDYVTSCAMLVRREVIEQIGEVDPAYFIYFDETDFCVRAQRRGWRVVFVPHARLWHKISRTMGAGSARYWFHYTRSRLVFVRKNFTPVHRAAALAYIALLDGPRMVGHFVRRRKLDCIEPYLRGLREGLTMPITDGHG